MNSTQTACTVVMYHYVRDLKNSQYPNIKGLDSALFTEQLLFLQKNYNFVTAEQVMESSKNGTSLPENAVLLTFDDGYKDHFHVVFPILDRMRIQGSFYIPVETATENKILDVNKIHFILEKAADSKELMEDTLGLLDSYRSDYSLELNKFYLDKLAHKSRYDTKETVFIKRLLQVELDEKLRNLITDELFRKYVTTFEKTFSRELYMNEEQISCMQRNGMHIGGHGNKHYWLGSLTKEQQVSEIDKSMEFIQRMGGNMDAWSMCYPYGSYNDDTLDILREKNCRLGLTTKVDVLNTATHDHLQVPRLDTNDLPKDGNASTNDWYLKNSILV